MPVWFGYHIPTFTNVTTMSTNHGVCRHHLIQNTCGMMRLHVIITQYAHT